MPWGAAIAKRPVATAVVGALALLLAPVLSDALLGVSGHADLVRWSVLGVAGIALSNLLIGLFAGRSDVTSPITYAAFGGTASLFDYNGGAASLNQRAEVVAEFKPAPNSTFAWGTAQIGTV